MFNLKFLTIIFLLVASKLVFAAATVKINVTKEKGTGSPRGVIIIEETKYGLLFIPKLSQLRPGIHGFHVHEYANCGNNGKAAGGHFDPKKTKKHLGPYNDRGHLGDLPAIYVNSDGTSTLPVLAPRLKTISEIKGKSLMIHEGGDTYTNIPHLGGGGSRMACGVIP